jgi:hypothetical protein
VARSHPPSYHSIVNFKSEKATFLIYEAQYFIEPFMLEVVNIKNCPDFGKLPGDVYIGRSSTTRYGTFPRSVWANPHHINQYNDRDDVLSLYREYLMSSGLINRIGELSQAKRLGCWCKPEPCHGDILVEILTKQTAQGVASNVV